LLAPVALAVGLVSNLLSFSMVSASVGRAFTATAEASGMYTVYSLPGAGLPVERFIDGGGPVSQAVVTADGTAQSFSSLPYPGATAIGAPGVAALVTEGKFVPPGYPFFVYAAHPTQPEQALSDPSGTYALTASAKDGSAQGDARVVPPGGGEARRPVAGARSEVVSEGDQVTATAVSLAEAVSVGPLSLGAVRSQSVSTYKEGDAKPTTKTELALEGGRAGDTTFSFGREGLRVAQQEIPLPAGEGLTAINKALEPAGLSIRFDEPTDLEGGAQAAAFEIVSVAQVPGAGAGTFRVRLGGATSFVSLGGEEEPLLGGGETPFVPADGSETQDPPVAADSAGDAAGFSSSASSSDPSLATTTGADAFSPGTGSETGAFGAAPEGASDAPAGGYGNGVPTAAPTQLAATSAGIDATLNLAGLLVAAVMAGVGVLGVWLWTKRRPAWTV
jgi:hypothetical protein